MMEENTGAKLSYKRMTPVFFVCKEQSSRMKSQLIKKGSAANRQSVRPIKRKDKKVVAFISGIKPRKRKSPAHKLYVGLFQWRKRWDSNPRAREGYLISSQARYDHFDTLPYCVYSIIMENFCAFILAKI